MVASIYPVLTYVMNVARKDYVRPVKVRNVIETNVTSLRRNVTSCISYFCVQRAT